MFSIRNSAGPGRLKSVAGVIMAVGFTVALLAGVLPKADRMHTNQSVAGGFSYQAYFAEQSKQ